jgi:hypothetical protein
MIIDSALRAKVIELHLNGRQGRNEIARKLKLSQGSVTNILRAYKANTGQAPTKAITDFPKASEPSPSPSQLQTSPTSEMKTTHEEAQEVQVQSSEVQDKDQDQDQEESFMDFGWSMVFKEVREAKKQRRDELLLIDRKKRELEEQKRQIDQEFRSVDRAKYELDSREAKVCEVEPLLPLARQLQDLGTDINQFLPWVETIHEKAETEKMDLRAAAYSVAQDLRSYRQVNSLQKSIQQMQQRLAMLNMLAMQKERALMVLMELQNRGVSLDEIYGLSKIIDLERLGKEWHNGIGEGNDNNMNMNGISNRGGNGGNNSTKAFKLDDK